MWRIWSKAAANSPAAAVLRGLLDWSKRRDRQVLAWIERQKQRRPFYVSG
jgi:hypothetical protein